MPKDDNSINYATRIPQDEASQIEEFRKGEGLNKSEAIRELVKTGMAGHSDVEQFRAKESLDKHDAVLTLIRAGLRQQNEKAHIFQTAATVSLGVLFAAGLVVIVSIIAAIVAVVLGALTVPLLAVVTIGLGTLLLLFLAGIVGAYFIQRGSFEAADREREKFRRKLEVRP